MSHKHKYLVGLLLGLCGYFLFMFGFDREFSLLPLTAFLAPTIFLSLNIKPKLEVEPVQGVKFKDGFMYVYAEKFDINKVQKVVIDEVKNHGFFALPFNQVNGKTLEFTFHKEAIDSFKNLINTYLPHVKFIK